jgi:acyl-CoA reductase-like NAD-dependent aldehyde dehydrogenase
MSDSPVWPGAGRELDSVLDRLAGGAPAWAATRPRGRARRIAALRRLVARRAGEIARLVADETSREEYEVLTQEVLPVLESLRYLERHMPGWLGPRRSSYLRPGFLRSRQWLVWEPLGLVAVLSPGNFPFSLGLMSAAWLALAGNTVVLKTSEKAPATSRLIASLLSEAGLAPSVIEVLEGDAETGRQVVAAPQVRKVFLFGSRRTGLAVAAVCRSRGVPFVLELGGGTTALVLANANLDRAAAAIVWSAFYARGDSCVGVDRVYVESSVERSFLARLEKELQDAPRRTGTCLPPRVLELVSGAAAAGARLLGPMGDPQQLATGGILAGVPKDAAILREEIGGPLVAVCAVADSAEGARLARGGHPALGVSIWTRDVRKARELAGEIGCAMTWVNDASFGLPNLPWGGRGATGSGALFSRHALHEAASLRWVSENPPSGRRPWWFPYSRRKLSLVLWAARFFR